MVDCSKCKRLLFYRTGEVHNRLINQMFCTITAQAYLASASNLLIFISPQGPPGPPGLQGPVGAPGISVSIPLCSANLYPHRSLIKFMNSHITVGFVCL